MSIDVINFSNGDTINYPLALLNGVLHNYNGERDSGVVFVRKLESNRLVSIWPLNGDQFKAFLELENGKNEFVLSMKQDDNDSNTYFCLIYVPPVTQSYFIRPVYIICHDHDGRFQCPDEEDCSVESACKRIYLSLQILQSYVAEKLFEQGLKRKTFSLERDVKDSSPPCHIFYSKLSVARARQMSAGELWIFTARELMSSPLFADKSSCKWMAFLSFTRYNGVEDGQKVPNSHREVLHLTQAHAALGGGGLALYGTGTLHCWAASVDEMVMRFLDGRKIDKRVLMDDSAYRGTRWANYSTGLGAVLHELSHTLDLSHTFTGIMARGFDDIHRSLISINHSKPSFFSLFSPSLPSFSSLYSFSLLSSSSHSSLSSSNSGVCNGSTGGSVVVVGDGGSAVVGGVNGSVVVGGGGDAINVATNSFSGVFINVINNSSDCVNKGGETMSVNGVYSSKRKNMLGSYGGSVDGGGNNNNNGKELNNKNNNNDIINNNNDNKRNSDTMDSRTTKDDNVIEKSSVELSDSPVPCYSPWKQNKNNTRNIPKDDNNNNNTINHNNNNNNSNINNKINNNHNLNNVKNKKNLNDGITSRIDVTDDRRDNVRTTAQERLFQSGKPQQAVISPSSPPLSSTSTMSVCNYDGTIATTMSSKNSDGTSTEVEFTKLLDGSLLLKENIIDHTTKRKKTIFSMTLVAPRTDISTDKSNHNNLIFPNHLPIDSSTNIYNLSKPPIKPLSNFKTIPSKATKTSSTPPYSHLTPTTPTMPYNPKHQTNTFHPQNPTTPLSQPTTPTTLTTTLFQATTRPSIIRPPAYLTTFMQSRFKDGGSHWYRSSALMLLRHLWLNPRQKCLQTPKLTLDGLVVSSEAGLHLIELRSVDSGLVFHHYEFEWNNDDDGGCDYDGDVDGGDDDDCDDDGDYKGLSVNGCDGTGFVCNMRNLNVSNSDNSKFLIKNKNKIIKKNIVNKYELKWPEILEHFRTYKNSNNNYSNGFEHINKSNNKQNNNEEGEKDEDIGVVVMDRAGGILKRKLSLNNK